MKNKSFLLLAATATLAITTYSCNGSKSEKEAQKLL